MGRKLTYNTVSYNNAILLSSLRYLSVRAILSLRPVRICNIILLILSSLPQFSGFRALAAAPLSEEGAGEN